MVGGDFIIKTQRVIAGIELSVAGTAVLNEVEGLYGATVQVREVIEPNVPGITGLNTDFTVAGASVDPNGNPLITINRKLRQLTEIDAVHELIHLKIKALDGNTKLHFQGSVGGQAEAYVRATTALILDPISHLRVNPLIRQTGLDPNEDFRVAVRKAISTNRVEPFSVFTQEQMRPIFYYIVNLELEDQTLIHQVRDLYNKNGWQNDLDFGQKLITTVKTFPPQNARGETEAYIKCLNLLFGGSASFELSKWETVKIGSIRQHNAFILVRNY